MYIGNTVQNQAYAPQVAYFSGNASTTAFTLPQPVASVAQMIVNVANVDQNPGSAYTVSGNTITFASAPPSGTNNIWVEYTSLITQVIAPSPGTVGSAQLQSGVALANLGYTPINKAGDTGVGTLALASNAGITFNNSSQYSGTTNSTLNDYETGTWTPNVGGTATYSPQVGTYTKIGNTVTVHFDFTIASIGTGSASALFGFPFTSGAIGAPQTGCVSYYAGLTVSPTFIAFYIANSSTQVNFVWNTTGGSTVQNNANNLFQSGSRIIGSLTYQASF